MGGIGSGNRCRYGKKTTTNEVECLDIRYLRKQGVLRIPGYIGTLTWSSNERVTGSIRYQIAYRGLSLTYRHRKNNEAWQDINEFVMFDRTPCRFGGERLWFLCPHCQRRVAILYSAGVRFLCRHCYDLTYACQQEALIDRMIRKARKIRDRLNAPFDLMEPIWDKPKGMHQRSFDRLVEADERANNISTAVMIQKFGLFDDLFLQ